MSCSLNIKEANTEYFDLHEPTFCAVAKKWFVAIRYDPRFYLHNDATIKFGTFVDFVPGEHRFTGLYKDRKLAVKIIKSYNKIWALKQQNVDLDAELVKELKKSYE